MSLPPRNIKNLFGSHEGPADQLEILKRFVEARQQELNERGMKVTDLLIYYVGHGDFAGDVRDFYLSLCRTKEDNPLLTSITARALGEWLRRCARGFRTYIIADCCFAGALKSSFLTSSLSVATLKLREAVQPDTFSDDRDNRSVPESGIALLAAAGSNQPADVTSDEKVTVFTGALLEVLRNGQRGGPEYLSLDDLHALVGKALSQRKFPVARPELHPLQQNRGRVEFVGLFPNFSTMSKTSKSDQRADDHCKKLFQEEQARARADANQHAKKLGEDEEARRKRIDDAEARTLLEDKVKALQKQEEARQAFEKVEREEQEFEINRRKKEISEFAQYVKERSREARNEWLAIWFMIPLLASIGIAMLMGAIALFAGGASPVIAILCGLGGIGVFRLMHSLDIPHSIGRARVLSQEARESKGELRELKDGLREVLDEIGGRSKPSHKY